MKRRRIELKKREWEKGPDRTISASKEPAGSTS